VEVAEVDTGVGMKTLEEYLSGNVEMALKCKHQRFEVKLWWTHSPISDWLTLIVCDEASNAQL